MIDATNIYLHSVVLPNKFPNEKKEQSDHLSKENSTDGRLKKIYGIKSEVNMFVLQLVRSRINRYLQKKKQKMRILCNWRAKLLFYRQLWLLCQDVKMLLVVLKSHIIY